MSLTTVGITGYRSIHKLTFPIRRLTVLVGNNGVGKTNLYRSLELIQAAAKGTLAEEIAREGGLGSIHFAGELKTHEKPRLVLEATLEDILESADALRYRIELGFRTPVDAAFELEAQVKSEDLELVQPKRTTALMERKGPTTWARNDDGQRIVADDEMLASETALSNLRGSYREIDAVRHAITSWRFYHAFRTDADSPLRRPARAITSPMLSADGSNLAAVFATLRHVRGESVDLDEAIDAAFPGAHLIVPSPEDTASFAMRFPELPKRRFAAHELSDGTLHYLALMGALLAYRLPPFIALNEPEASLHPDLLPHLAGLIVKAAARTQIWIVTHSRILADAIAQQSGVIPRDVIRKNGATWLDGLTQFGEFEDD
jgi:predicted ATPase